MKTSPDSGVRFAGTEEELKKHERASGPRNIKRRKLKAGTLERTPTDSNPDYDKTADFLHCKCTFAFFWSGDEQQLRHLVERGKDDIEFCQSIFALANTMASGLPDHGCEELRRQTPHNSLAVILKVRETQQRKDACKKLMTIDSEHIFNPRFAANLRNFRACKAFTDFIYGVEQDPTIVVDTTSAVLKGLQEATNEKIGDLVFANMYNNLRRGTTSTSDTGNDQGESSESSKHPADSPESTEHPGGVPEMGYHVARKKVKRNEETKAEKEE